MLRFKCFHDISKEEILEGQKKPLDMSLAAPIVEIEGAFEEKKPSFYRPRTYQNTTSQEGEANEQ